MYKKTTESAHYIQRSGSHSTKGSRRGFVPDWFTGFDKSMAGDNQENIERLMKIRDGLAVELTSYGATRKQTNHKNLKNRTRLVALRAISAVEDGVSPNALSRYQQNCVAYHLAGVQIAKITEKERVKKAIRKADIPSCFIEAARNTLPSDLFAEVLSAAREMAKKITLENHHD
jgi:hypothetical protein